MGHQGPMGPHGAHGAPGAHGAIHMEALYIHGDIYMFMNHVAILAQAIRRHLCRVCFGLKTWIIVKRG